MTRTIFALLLCALTMGACTKDDKNNNNNGGGNAADNTFKLTKGGGAGTVNVTISNVTCGTENSSNGTFHSSRAFFNVGANSTYDRLAFGFKTEPADGSYPIVFQQYYADLPADKAGANITYDAYNYITNAGAVTVSTVNGKKKVSFTDLVLESGVAVPGTSGTKLPDGSTITGSVVCP